MYIIYYYYIGIGDLDILLKCCVVCRLGKLNGEMFCFEFFVWCGGNVDEICIFLGIVW